jgi:hypothetical protein
MDSPTHLDLSSDIGGFALAAQPPIGHDGRRAQSLAGRSHNVDSLSPPMRLQVSDIIGFGAIATSVFIYLKARQKTFIWLLILIGVPALAVSIFSRSERVAPKREQSANASGGSTITQVGGDLTVNQGGLSEDDRNMIRGLVKQKSFGEMANLTRKYRHGFLIFGLSPDGIPITYKGELRDIWIKVNWSNLRVQSTDSGRLLISMPSISVVYKDGGSLEAYDNVENHPFIENEPIVSMAFDRMFYEVDAEKRSLVIGFK